MINVIKKLTREENLIFSITKNDITNQNIKTEISGDVSNLSNKILKRKLPPKRRYTKSPPKVP
ncbi:MAG: hypothetical protein ACK4NX_02010, partial [Candidatus Paceibacteria bacterium]